MLLANKTVAIVGGGPGGLTLARLLQRKGVDVKVYERDKDKFARKQGATLDLHYESGLRALREGELMEEFKKNYRPGADRLTLADKNAVVHFAEYGKDIMLDLDSEYARPEIDRGPLQQILLDSLLPGTVVWDSQFLNMAAHGKGWKLEFKNGTTVVTDLVIAADGGNSKLRPYLTPVTPFYSGIMVVEGAVYNSASATPNIHKLLNGGKIFAFGDDKSLIVSSKGDGSLVFYTGCKFDADWPQTSGLDFNDKAQIINWFKSTYIGWDDIYLELFENSTVPFIIRPIYCMPFDQTWQALPNLTILGDAAHLMPPFAGEGVNMAMLDALELSQCLLNKDYADTHTAITAYEQQMRTRASEVAK